jgi:hypothetical protein
MSQGGFIPIELHPVAIELGRQNQDSGVFATPPTGQNPYWAYSLLHGPEVSLMVCRGVKIGYIYSPVDSQWYQIIFQWILKYQDIITFCIRSLASWDDVY